MPDGNVGGGNQNRYEPTGEILCADKKVMKFRKGNRKQAIRREDPPCWNAGTPVRWDEPIEKDDEGRAFGKFIKVTKVDIGDGKGGSLEVLATLTTQDKPTEYHPLIQFFNEVMAGIVRDKMTRDLDNLKGPTSARRLWTYLQHKYLRMTDSTDLFDLLKEFYEAQDKEGLPDIDWDNLKGPGKQEAREPEGIPV